MTKSVLRLITWLPVGGIEQKLVSVLPRIQASGRYRVHVCCLRERGPLADDLEEAGVPVDVIPFRKRWDFRALGQLKHFVQRHNFDIIHSHMYRSNVPGAVAGRLAHAPVIIGQIHNIDTWETRRQLWMDRFLMRWRDAVVGVSEAVRRDMIEKLAIPESKARLIYNGIALDQFASPMPGARERLRAEWGIPCDAVVAVMLSRIHSQKNPLGLLEAFAVAASRNPHLYLVYAGDGPQRADLEAAIAERQLGDRVKLIGMRRDIPDVLAATDFSVLPSFKEGFSNTILESMAASRPVLCTDVGGASEVVESGKNGLIIPPGDLEALIHGLERLGGDMALRKVFGDAAANRVRRFSLQRMAEDTMDLYDELLKHKGRG